MNKLLTYAAILCGAMMVSGLTSCSSSPVSEVDTVDLLPVRTSWDGRWSMIDNKGKIVYDSEFEKSPTMAINGCFSVKEGDSYTLYKIGEKKPEVVKGCENLNAIGKMSGGLIPIVRPGKRIEIVNKSGETEFELSPIDNVEVFSCKESFSNGLLCVMTTEEKYGFVNKKGKCVIPCIYDSAWSFEDGYAIVGKRQEDFPPARMWYVIDTSGNQVLELGESLSCPFMFHGYAKIDDGDQSIITDMDGNKHKLPFNEHSLVDMRDELIIYSDEDHNYGLVNLDGEIIISAKYDDLRFAFNGDLIAKESSDSHEILILDTKGEKKQTIGYDNIRIFDGFGYVGVEGNVYTVLDTEFKKTSKEEFCNYGVQSSTGTIKSDYVNHDLD